MSAAQNSGGTAGKVGRPYRPGQSGNPGGRPKDLARSTRELVGEDGMALAELWWQIAQDPMRRDSDRLEASKLLAAGASASGSPRSRRLDPQREGALWLPSPYAI